MMIFLKRTNTNIMFVVAMTLFLNVGIVFSCPPPWMDPVIFAGSDLFSIYSVDTVYTLPGQDFVLDFGGSYDPENGSGYELSEYEWDFSYDGNNFNVDYSEDSSSDGKVVHSFDSVGSHTVAFRGTGVYSTTDIDICIVKVSQDGDSDGLPDAWEVDYFGNITSNDGYDDAENSGTGDGFSNLCEYYHRVSPTAVHASISDNAIIPINDSDYILQRTVDAMFDGDEVLLNPGTYIGGLIVDSNIVVSGADPNDWKLVAETIITSEPNSVVVTINEDSANPVMEGLTIAGGQRGMRCIGLDGTSEILTLRNLIIQNNINTNSNGGGLYIDDSRVDAFNCVFAENVANRGGGIYLDNDANLVIYNSIFWHNHAKSMGVMADTLGDPGDGGAGIYKKSGELTVHNCTFSRNFSKTNNGSAIYNCGSNTTANIYNSLFWDNPGIEDNTTEIYNSTFNSCITQASGGNNSSTSSPKLRNTENLWGDDGILSSYDDGLVPIYAKKSTNSAIDTAYAENATTTFDITGLERVDNGCSNDGSGTPNYADIGAYEVPRLWFVDGDAEGTNNGNTWTNAFDSLQGALTNVSLSNGDWIFVRQGTYTPDNSDVNISFELLEGIKLFGGFDPYDYNRDWSTNYQWNSNYTSVLSGDIEYSEDNSKIIIEGASGVVLDGFIIEGGYNPTASGAGMKNDNCSVLIKNCVFRNNEALNGAGMYNDSDCEANSVVIKNCIFEENVSDSGDGGAVYNQGGNPLISNSVFVNNSAENGGAIADYNSLCSIINCTFSENYADDITGAGDVIYNTTDSNIVVSNSILWNDYVASQLGCGNTIENISSDVLISYSDIEGCGGSGPANWNSSIGIDDGNNIDDDPVFSDTETLWTDDNYGTLEDGLFLDDDSPCVDVGINSYIKSPLDILLLERIVASEEFKDVVDLGAYEKVTVPGSQAWGSYNRPGEEGVAHIEDEYKYHFTGYDDLALGDLTSQKLCEQIEYKLRSILGDFSDPGDSSDSSDIWAIDEKLAGENVPDYIYDYDPETLSVYEFDRTNPDNELYVDIYFDTANVLNYSNKQSLRIRQRFDNIGGWWDYIEGGSTAPNRTDCMAKIDRKVSEGGLTSVVEYRNQNTVNNINGLLNLVKGFEEGLYPAPDGNVIMPVYVVHDELGLIDQSVSDNLHFMPKVVLVTERARQHLYIYKFLYDSFGDADRNIFIITFDQVHVFRAEEMLEYMSGTSTIFPKQLGSFIEVEVEFESDAREYLEGEIEDPDESLSIPEKAALEDINSAIVTDHNTLMDIIIDEFDSKLVNRITPAHLTPDSFKGKFDTDYITKVSSGILDDCLSFDGTDSIEDIANLVETDYNVVDITSGSVIISEIISKSSVEANDGDEYDYIEIYNQTENTVSLNGWYLTDKASEINKWAFPNMNIAANAYLGIFCDGPAGELSTTFGLKNSGEYVGLYQGATVKTEYTPSFPADISEDISYGVIESDGQFIEGYLRMTPGFANKVCVYRPQAVKLGDNDFTISLWLNTDESDVAILSKCDGNDDVSWDIGERQLYIDSNGKIIFIGGSTVGSIVGTTSVDDSKWHHVVVTFNDTAGIGKVYLDGEDDTYSATFAGDSDSSTADIVIGHAVYGSVSSNFIGYMDDLAIWNVTLDSSDIENIYIAGLNERPLSTFSGLLDGLLYYVPMDKLLLQTKSKYEQSLEMVKKSKASD